MNNVTPLHPPKAEQPKLTEIIDTIIRAKQVVRAVRVAQEHEDEDFWYALELVEDLLEGTQHALSTLEDAQDRAKRKSEEVES